MEERKLYEVTVAYTFYAYAESGVTAALLADDAIRDASSGDYATARAVMHSDARIACDWDRKSLVYHEGDEDLELGDLLDKLPARVGK